MAEYDLRSPEPIWGMDEYDKVVLLVRDGSRPLAVFSLPIHRKVGVLAPVDIDRLIATRAHLGAYALRELPDRSSAGKGAPGVSVVICTKDRPNPLDRCLQALGKVRYERYEVVVVDNGSRDDSTARVAARHGARCIREVRPGLDRARNRGFQEATHDVIAFIDDDVQVDPDWLVAVGTAFEDPAIDAVTGLVLPLELETRAQNYFEMYGDGMNKGFEARVFEPSRLNPSEMISVQHIGVGANMAFRRDALLSVGGFDPALDVGTPAAGAGDLDMFHRMLASGRAIRYEPKALVWHQHRRDMQSLTSQIYNNGRSFGVYLLKLLRAGEVPARSLVRYAGWTWGRWLVGRLVLGLLRRHRLPTRLLWAELKGAIGSPMAFLATYRWARRTEGPTP